MWPSSTARSVGSRSHHWEWPSGGSAQLKATKRASNSPSALRPYVGRRPCRPPIAAAVELAGAVGAFGVGREFVDDGGIEGVLAARFAIEVAVLPAALTEEVAGGRLRSSFLVRRL